MIVLPAEGRREPVPSLPMKRPAWLKETREWWKRIWTSPMPTQWLKVEYWTLLRLAYMVEAEKRGEANASLLREMRYLEDAFGLSPASRLRLRWEIGPQGGAEVRPQPSRRRVPAIDPAGSR